MLKLARERRYSLVGSTSSTSVMPATLCRRRPLFFFSVFYLVSESAPVSASRRGSLSFGSVSHSGVQRRCPPIFWSLSSHGQQPKVPKRAIQALPGARSTAGAVSHQGACVLAGYPERVGRSGEEINFIDFARSWCSWGEEVLRASKKLGLFSERKTRISPLHATKKSAFAAIASCCQRDNATTTPRLLFCCAVRFLDPCRGSGLHPSFDFVSAAHFLLQSVQLAKSDFSVVRRLLLYPFTPGFPLIRKQRMTPAVALHRTQASPYLWPASRVESPHTSRTGRDVCVVCPRGTRDDTPVGYRGDAIFPSLQQKRGEEEPERHSEAPDMKMALEEKSQQISSSESESFVAELNEIRRLRAERYQRQRVGVGSPCTASTLACSPSCEGALPRCGSDTRGAVDSIGELTQDTRRYLVRHLDDAALLQPHHLGGEKGTQAGATLVSGSGNRLEAAALGGTAESQRARRDAGFPGVGRRLGGGKRVTLQSEYAPRGQSKEESCSSAQLQAPSSQPQQLADSNLAARKQAIKEEPVRRASRADRGEVIDVDDERTDLPQKNRNLRREDCTARGQNYEDNLVGTDSAEMDEAQLPIWNDEFDVLTWNVDGLDEAALRPRTASVIYTIRQLRPAVVMLQEVIPTSLAMLAGHLAPLYHIYPPTVPSFGADVLAMLAEEEERGEVASKKRSVSQGNKSLCPPDSPSGSGSRSSSSASLPNVCSAAASPQQSEVARNDGAKLLGRGPLPPPGCPYFCVLMLCKEQMLPLQEALTEWFPSSQMGRHLVGVVAAPMSRPQDRLLFVTSHLESMKGYREERVSQLRRCLQIVTRSFRHAGEDEEGGELGKCIEPISGEREQHDEAGKQRRETVDEERIALAAVFGGDTNLRDSELTGAHLSKSRPAFDRRERGKPGRDSKARTGGRSGSRELDTDDQDDPIIPPTVRDVWEALGRPAECMYTWDMFRNDNKQMKWRSRLRFDRLYWWSPSSPSSSTNKCRSEETCTRPGCSHDGKRVKLGGGGPESCPVSAGSPSGSAHPTPELRETADAPTLSACESDRAGTPKRLTWVPRSLNLVGCHRLPSCGRFPSDHFGLFARFKRSVVWSTELPQGKGCSAVSTEAKRKRDSSNR
ncbi:endonuclease exonuclease phosphatase family protein [Cystoisospora suis]|uniref:Endonuclease exonuclease phosphatase family protein n=1 Tax=Cystoisospora suis TaxID=483139 RepID=A0A2C6LAE2_9APIC|nr:endonuclease exonuclease phosphatase family protein [Cystoisospora suis]